MLCIDTSCLIAYLEGEVGEDVARMSSGSSRPSVIESV